MALVGLWLGLWLALVGSAWGHLGAILGPSSGACVGSGWALGVILGLSWGHLEAKKATERRQKSDRDTVYNSVFLSLLLALDGL